MNIVSKPTLIIVPTYHEEPNIMTLLQGIFQHLPTAHVLFVDDNSQDGTQQRIEQFAQQQQQRNGVSQVFLIRRPGKLGLGTAYLDGFAWGLSREYEYFIEMDADLSHDPKYLPSMMKALAHHDVAIGSRYVAGGGTENWGMLRKVISRFGSFYARSLLQMRVRDLTGGFNGWRRQVLEQVNLGDVKSEGYAFQIELKYRAFLGGYRIGEFPIVFVDRYAGKSKMSARIVWEAMFRVWSLRSLGLGTHDIVN